MFELFLETSIRHSISKRHFPKLLVFVHKWHNQHLVWGLWDNGISTYHSYPRSHLRKWFTLSHDVEIRGSFGGQLPYQNLSQFAYSLHVTTAISSNSGNKLFGMCAVSPNIDPQLLPKFHHFQIHFPCAVFSNLRQRRSFHEVHFQPFNLVSSLSLKAGR